MSRAYAFVSLSATRNSVPRYVLSSSPKPYAVSPKPYSEYPDRYVRVRNSLAAALFVTRMFAPS